MARQTLTTGLLTLGRAPVLRRDRPGRRRTPRPRPGGRPRGNAAAIERGAYLVSTMGCHDCHTPWKMGPKGPEPDMSRALTGHPADVVMPPPRRCRRARGSGWAAATNTAFAGPGA
jgi:hypothetical protein